MVIILIVEGSPMYVHMHIQCVYNQNHNHKKYLMRNLSNIVEKHLTDWYSYITGDKSIPRILPILLKLLLSSLETSFVIFPCVIGLVTFFNPCQIPFLGGLLFNRESCLDFSTKIWIRLPLALFEFGVMLRLCVIGGFYVVYVLLMGILHLWIESISGPTLTFRKYRRVQIVEKLVNGCNRFRIFPTVAVIFPAVQIIGGFALIRWDERGTFTYIIHVHIQFNRQWINYSLIIQ